MQIKRSGLIALGVLVILVVISFFIGGHDGKLHVYFLDIGQGDAMFVQTPGGKQILIDGGPDQTVLQRLGEVMPFYDRTIDLVVATHPDADHLAGLVSVLEKYRVASILETGMQCETALCAEWEKIVPKEQAVMNYGNLGEEINIEEGVKLLILNPFFELKDQKLSSRNNGAVVLKLMYGKQTVLLTADIEASIERKMLVSDLNLKADFLKIAHHGSKTSTTEDFLKAVAPKAAFIEVGRRNRYGHPTEEVLGRLENLSIPYYRTDTQGTIELVLDGKDYQILTGSPR
ncbi:MAG: ComEC/Rec2 family competence protein [bacterium]|nr:ComEC/Rec2 family competence protein [bacterium]